MQNEMGGIYHVRIVLDKVKPFKKISTMGNLKFEIKSKMQWHWEDCLFLKRLHLSESNLTRLFLTVSLTPFLSGCFFF